MLKRIVKWTLIVVALVVLCSFANDLMTYHIDRRAGVDFGKYHEYSGVIHIHSTYSDGSGSYESISRTCDSLGLHFAIFTDHNTVAPFHDSLDKRFGVTLVVPAVEISTDGEHGHFLVIGDSLPLVPRNGVSSDSVFSHSLNQGSTVILAHVFHPRNSLDWDNWNIGKFTGIELYNFDEGWRSTLNLSQLNKLIGACLAYKTVDYPLNYVLRYPDKEMRKFDELNSERKVIGIGSLDAHANVKIGKDSFVHFPSYGKLFSLVHTVIVTREAFDGTYWHDREILLNAIRNGNSFVSFSGLEEARGFLFTAASGSSEATMGDSLKLLDAARLTIELPDSNNIVIQLVRNGNVIESYNNRGSVMIETNEPGVYRVQVFQKRTLLPLFIKRWFPWILSNPIYICR